MVGQPQIQGQRGTGRPSRRDHSRPALRRPEPPASRVAHRLLVLRGLTVDEAANLVAFRCGIRVGEQPWTVAEVNRLLFLRELSQLGRIGGALDTATAGP